jgi:hypothetical protein
VGLSNAHISPKGLAETTIELSAVSADTVECTNSKAIATDKGRVFRVNIIIFLTNSKYKKRLLFMQQHASVMA